MQHNLIDTHCHLDFDVFNQDRERILRECRALGVSDIVVPAVAADCFETTRACAEEWQTPEIARTHSRLHHALGLHPVYIEQHQADHLVCLDDALNKSSALAVGEIGLDFYEARISTPELKEKQTVFFSKQIIIALKHKLPLIIHNRKAHDLCLSLLQEIGSPGGIIHAFNGSIQQAHKYRELGFKLGFGGMLTFARSRKLRSLVEQLPLDCIVLETDAPDMTVAQHQGQRNSPEYLPYVMQAVAQIKSIGEAEVARVTTENAKNVLGIS